MIPSLARHLLRCGAAAITTGVVAGCSGSALPGSMLGTYTVTATSQSNTCGTGLGAPDPWKFDVQLSESGETLYLSFMDGSPILSNVLDAQLQTTLTSGATGNVDAAPDGAPGPCTMQRSDDIEIALGSGSPPGVFQGTIQYTFSVPTGYTCTDQLSSTGGMYDTLPCDVSYAMSGVRQ
jgi:hypothetical protein